MEFQITTWPLRRARARESYTADDYVYVPDDGSEEESSEDDIPCDDDGKIPQYSTLPRPADKSDAAAKRAEEEDYIVDPVSLLLQDAQHTANGDTKTGTKAPRSPPAERKQSRFAALGKIFKPWKWKRRKKPSEKIEAQAVELERKISLRTTREELIKRGVLKDEFIPSSISEETNIVSNGRRPESSMYETIRSQLVFHPKYHEAEEAVQEEKSDSGVHANGTSSTADSVHLGDHPDIGDHGNQVIHSDPSINDHRTYVSNNGSVSSHDVTSNMHNMVSSNQVRLALSEEEQKNDSPRVDVKQIRVMIPVEERDRQIPVIQSMQRNVPNVPTLESVGTRQDMTPPTSRTGNSPVVNQGMPYTMPSSKTVHMGPYSPGVGQMTPPAQMYEEVPAREPDPKKKKVPTATLR